MYVFVGLFLEYNMAAVSLNLTGNPKRQIGPLIVPIGPLQKISSAWQIK